MMSRMRHTLPPPCSTYHSSTTKRASELWFGCWKVKMKFKYPMDGFAKESQDTENPEIALFYPEYSTVAKCMDSAASNYDSKKDKSSCYTKHI